MMLLGDLIKALQQQAMRLPPDTLVYVEPNLPGDQVTHTLVKSVAARIDGDTQFRVILNITPTQWYKEL